MSNQQLGRVYKKTCVCGYLISGTRDDIDLHKQECIQKRIDRLRPGAMLSSSINKRRLTAYDQVSTIDAVQRSESQNAVEDGRNEEAYDDQHFDYEDFTDSIEEIPESSTNIRDSQPKEQQTLASAVLQDSRNIINISEDITANTSSPTTEVAYASSTTDTSSATKSRVLSKKAKIYDMRRPTFHSEEEHVKTSIKNYAAAVKHQGSRELYEKWTKCLNGYTQGVLPPLYSYNKARQALRDSYPIKPIEYDVCPNGCKMYIPSDDSLQCEYEGCHAPRYRNDGKTPTKKMQQLPLKEQLALFVSDIATREMLRYRSNRQSSDDVMIDIFDGAVYKDIKTKTKLFEGDMDIALALYTDGFQKARRGKHSMTIVHLVILNLPPEKRTEDKNMLQVCIIPGPKNREDMFSFLDPALQELRELCKEGMIVKTDTEHINITAHLLFVGGDIPAVAKMAGHASHNHYHGCRFCTIRGVYQEGRLTYPAVKKNRRGSGGSENNSNNNNNNNNTSRQRAYTRLKPVIRKSATYRSSDSRMGQSKASPFADLPTFHGATFFPIDIMHNLGLGCSKQLWKMISGDYGKDGNPLYLKRADQELLGSRIAASRGLTPPSFAGDCSDIAFQSGFYRAVDWIHFALYFVPTTLLEFYDDPSTREALTSFATIYKYAFSREINKNQIISLKDAVKIWAKWLDTQVEAQNMSAAVFTINQHYLSHLHTTIERNGPLPYLAAFNMERAIGEIKRRIRSKINAGVNSGNVLVDLSAVRRRKRLERDDDNNDDDDENDEDEERPNHAVNVINKKSRMDVISISDDRDSPEIWGPFAEQSIQELHCKNQLRHFWAWHNESYTGINIDVDEVVETGTRLQMNKNTYGGSVRESFVRLHIDVDIDRRISKAKVNPAKRQYVGDIKYFFKHGCIVRGEYCEKLLAFVKIYKTVKVSGPWPYKTDNGGSKHVVVDIESIVGFVGKAKGFDTREYVYWSQNNSHTKKELPFDYNLDFIPR